MSYEAITESVVKNVRSLSTITEERTTTTLTTQSSLKCQSKISLPVIEESTKEEIPGLEKKIPREKSKPYKRPVRKFPCYNAVGHRAEPPRQLFGTVASERRKVVTPKMLVTGFGLRNIESLQVFVVWHFFQLSAELLLLPATPFIS